MKLLMKRLVVAVLGWQVRRLRARNEFKIVAVVGSYGKTSTKAAIAQVLGTVHDVQWQEGNYNDTVSVPLVFFGIKMPKLLSIKAWLKVFWRVEQQLKEPYPYDIVVLELGTDGPGQLAEFARYLEIDIAVLTSVGPEHMEFFKSVEEVAKEELSIGRFTKRLLVNASLVDKMFIDLTSYELEPYRVTIPKTSTLDRWSLEFEGKTMQLSRPIISEAQAFSLSSAYVVGKVLDMNGQQLELAMGAVTGMQGRMNILDGKNGSKIIDDSYNSSPEAAKLALQTLYRFPAKKRIALLGSMNELGRGSANFHTEVGEFCDPKRIDLLITLGVDANEYLAAAAEGTGCKVERAATPHEAGKRIAKELKEGVAVLVKGSQNGVYAEEAIKSLLANPSDESKLIRQNPKWLAKKQKNFSQSVDA